MPIEQERRLLIVTGAAVAEVEKLPPPVRSLIEAASEILVVSPVSSSRPMGREAGCPGLADRSRARNGSGPR